MEGDRPGARLGIGRRPTIGSAIIRWQSIGNGLTRSSASTTGSPSVRLGTKWLSMTSTWAQSALLTDSSSACRLAKSADRMLGEICTPPP
jgi:hypothetical protein